MVLVFSAGGPPQSPQQISRPCAVRTVSEFTGTLRILPAIGCSGA